MVKKVKLAGSGSFGLTNCLSALPVRHGSLFHIPPCRAARIESVGALSSMGQHWQLWNQGLFLLPLDPSSLTRGEQYILILHFVCYPMPFLLLILTYLPVFLSAMHQSYLAIGAG